MGVASKDNKARVSFAPGKTDAYIIVRGDHEEPDGRDNGRIYEGAAGLEQAQERVEWLNWAEGSKQKGVFRHPREERAAQQEQARAQLLAAHRALLERERYGVAVATQLGALRDALRREEDLAADCARKAAQEGYSAKDRKTYRQGAQQAQRRAQGLAAKIVDLEASPVLPSRLAGAARRTEQKEDGREGTAP